jgi:hypothetical protein
LIRFGEIPVKPLEGREELVGNFFAKARNSEIAKFGGVEQTGNDWQSGAGSRKRDDRKMADKKMGIGECFLGGVKG